MRWLCLVMLATACRIDFDPVVFAVADSGAPGDACAFGAFSAPVSMASINSTSNEWAPWLSPDGLEILFSSDRPGGAGNFDVYRATRAATNLAFDPPQRIAEVSTSGDDDDAFLSPDGLTLWMSSPGPSANTERITSSTRTARGAPFSTPQQLAELVISANQRTPDLTADLRTIVFNSDLAGGTGGLDLYQATRAQPSGAFSGITELAALDSNGDECCFAFGPPGDLLYVSTGLDGTGHARIFHVDSVTGSPSVFAPTNPPSPTTTDEWDPFWSADGSTIVFSSSRAGGTGGLDLFEITRTCL